VSDRKSLKARIAAMTEQFDEVLVQQYIAGREFNVGIVGDRTLPIAEIDFTAMPEGAWPILTYAAKWHVGSPRTSAAVPCARLRCLNDSRAVVSSRRNSVAYDARQGVRTYRHARRQCGRPWILEVNPNPDLTDEAGLSRMAKAAGWEYPELVRRIAEGALREAQGTKAARELLAAPLTRPAVPAARRARAPRTA